MTERVIRTLRRRRVLILAGFDAGVWIASMVLFSRVRWELADNDGFVLHRALVVGVVAAILHVVSGLPVRLHHGRAAPGSLEEMLHLGAVVSLVGAAVTVGNLFVGHYLPASVPFAATFFALVVMAWARAGYRTYRERVMGKGADTAGRTPVIVVGAGDAGRQLVRSMLMEQQGKWRPVGLLDDNSALRHRRIRGIPVMGTTQQLADVAARTGAATAIIAIPSATAETIRVVSTLADEAGVALKVLPTTTELLGRGRVDITDVRDIEVTDLLGRRQIDTDVAAIAGYLRGRRVLVTGAGGSIGSELARQIAQFGPSELILLDRDESALHAVQLSIDGEALLDTDAVVLADIREGDRLREIFLARRPDVVFHAAALKHLPMLEQYPGEAIKTNVWGTLSILEAAKAAGVSTFVNISTDKAAKPCSVLGYSKRLAEGLTATFSTEADGTYLSVRFGNVLASRGSVLTSFAAQIASGGPVTVTDPGVTRYFMTVQEAVQLVIQAAAIGDGGEVLILDMGDPVSIDGVARRLIRLSGKDVPIRYTGLRAGEKMHEDLFGEGESDVRRVHPLISHTSVPRFDKARARALNPKSEPSECISQLATETAAMTAPVGGDRAEFRTLLSPPDVTELEHGYVLRALQSGWVAPVGPDLDAFETEMSERLGVAHAVGLSSGTAALHLALVSWGVGPGDVVPVSTLTFAASVNAIRYVGAEPFFVDCDRVTGNMSPDLLDEALTALAAAGRNVPVVVVVDMLGRAADYSAIAPVVQRHGARLLCDAAESLGASHRGVPCGRWGDASVLSFNGNKVMTTSGGGMLLTDDPRLAQHVRKLATQAREPVPHYEHNEVGFNYRLSNLLAALGRGQLARLDDMLARRRGWRAAYRSLAAEFPGVTVLGGPEDREDNCWLTAFVIDSTSRVSADDVQRELRAGGIETRPLWKPMHAQPVHRGHAALLDGSADYLFAHGVTLPSGSGMSESEHGDVLDALRSCLGAARVADPDQHPAAWPPESNAAGEQPRATPDLDLQV